MSESIQPTAIVEPPAVPPRSRSRLATTALILGIGSVFLGATPILSFLAFLPAVLAAVLGIVVLATKRLGRGRAIAGIVLGAVAFVVAIGVSVGSIGLAVSGVDSVADRATATPAPSREPEPTAEAEPELEPEPAPAPAPAPTVPADVAYSGVGDSILQIQIPDGADEVSVATLSHAGSSNFAVWALDSGMAQQSLLVNTIGAYQGTVLFNDELGSSTIAFEIAADGPWTVTVRSILSLREFAGNAATGLGDDVLIYRGAAGAASVTHDGQSNFAVWTHGSMTDLVINEIGVYTGTVRWGAGPSLVEVTADGNWSVTVG